MCGKSDWALAVPFFQKACDGKNGEGCYELGRIYSSAQGASQDYKRALALFEQACQLGSRDGCTGAAELTRPNDTILPDAKRWATFMEKACDVGGQGEAETCLKLGLHFDLGLLVPKDPERANDLFKKACLYGNKEACKLIVRK